MTKIKSDREEEYLRYPDNGCWRATAYLKRQSYCLECPFAECLEGDSTRPEKDPSRTERNKQIIITYSKGEKIMALAKKFGLNKKTIYRIIKLGIGEDVSDS